MKKLFLITLTAVSCTAVIFSCTKKDSNPSGVYTCTCSYTLSGTVHTNEAMFTTPSEPKSTATTQCNAEASALTSGTATGVSCHL